MEFDRIGKYQILGEIGRGTMGRVFRGLDPALNRPVAVKTLSLALGVARDARERFRREAQAAALLSHPNIVTVYDFGEEHGHIFMAMEFLEGIAYVRAHGEVRDDRVGIGDEREDGRRGVGFVQPT